MNYGSSGAGRKILDCIYIICSNGWKQKPDFPLKLLRIVRGQIHLVRIPILSIMLGMGHVAICSSAPIVYDFDDVPVGSYPVGVNLTVNGVGAHFGGLNLSVEIDPITGNHILRTRDYTHNIGVQLPFPAAQIVVGINDNVPEPGNNFVSATHYYNSNYGLSGMPRIGSYGPTLVFDVPGDFAEVYGLSIGSAPVGTDSGAGFAVDYFAIEFVPEPGIGTFAVMGIASAWIIRIRKR